MATATHLSNILTWSQYFFRRGLKPEKPEILEHAYTVRPELNEKVSLWQGDITTIKADAIVNAANMSLLGGGGVDGTVHAAAGSELRKECETLGGCEVGHAKITGGYNLPAKRNPIYIAEIIHAVGTFNQNPFELANTYKSCFQLMLSHSIRSIAFPCISTGAYAYDNMEAAHIAIRETRHFLQTNHQQVNRVIFCVYGDKDLKVYEELLQRYFPVKYSGL